jgi:hypothetical protein
MGNLPLEFRPMTKADEAFIFSTWLKSYRHSQFASDMSNDVFFTYHKGIVADILKVSKVILIVNPEDPDQIYGYAVAQQVGSRLITHFVYVKYNFRKLGLAKAIAQHMNLFSESVNFITHVPRNYKSFKGKLKLEYCPYLLAEVITP